MAELGHTKLGVKFCTVRVTLWLALYGFSSFLRTVSAHTLQRDETFPCQAFHNICSRIPCYSCKQCIGDVQDFVSALCVTLIW